MKGILLFIGGVVTIIFVLGWIEADIPWINWLISQKFISYWVPLITFVAFLLTLYRVVKIQNELNAKKQGALNSCKRICAGLTEDILSLTNRSERDITFYVCINALRARLEVNLEYCQQCCADSKTRKGFNKWALDLSRHEHNLRSVIKDITNGNFKEDKFVSDLGGFRAFLQRQEEIV